MNIALIAAITVVATTLIILATAIIGISRTPYADITALAPSNIDKARRDMINNIKINPFDVLSGKIVQNHRGTFWFKEEGNNMRPSGYPIYENLHNGSGPAIIWKNGNIVFFKNGKKRELTFINGRVGYHYVSNYNMPQ